MSRALSLGTLVLAAAFSSGCTYAPSIHAPRYAAPNELVLSYDEGYVLSAGGRQVAKGYGYEGLTSFVGCVPAARAHAYDAESNGAAVAPLQISGLVLSVGGLGGLGGLYYLDRDTKMMTGFLLGGLGMQLVGLALVAAGAQAKVSANGHAVDAMNHYNDAVGSQGAACAPAGKRYW